MSEFYRVYTDVVTDEGKTARNCYWGALVAFDETDAILEAIRQVHSGVGNKDFKYFNVRVCQMTVSDILEALDSGEN